MTKSLPILAAAAIGLGALPAAASGNGVYDRLLACGQGSGVMIEVFIPVESGAFAVGTLLASGATGIIRGLYSLDLSEANKGKRLEPVNLKLTPNKQAVIVDQFTRGLPPTVVPLKGGVVSFDNRFAADVTCKPAGWRGTDDE